MENERREQAAPATPILDSILAKLRPPRVEGPGLRIRPTAVSQAFDRLSKKMEAGTLTQRDIENELNSLPAIGGFEEVEVKKQLVRLIQMNIDHYDIRALPVE